MDLKGKQEAKQTQVGFIGIGNMGAGMCANLVKAGFRVKAYDLVPGNIAKAVESGCCGVSSAVEAVAGSDVVVSMLPNGTIVENLYLDKDALLDHLPAGTLVLDCSTISPNSARRVGEAAAKNRVRFVDAPVSGGVAAASAGALAFMCGGSEEDCSAATEILQAMGSNVFRAGEHGAGQVAKICNNMLLAIHMAGTAEALQLGMDNGLDPSVLSEIMLKSSGANWSLEKYNPVPGVMEGVPASRDYQGGFMVDLMLKDLGLALEVSQSSRSSVPMGSAARSLFNLHKHVHGEDWGSRDFSSIYRLYHKGFNATD